MPVKAFQTELQRVCGGVLHSQYPLHGNPVRGCRRDPRQIHGGYGFTEDFSPARALRDSRINRPFIPTALIRRAQRGRFPLHDAAPGADDEFRRQAPPADTGDMLKNALGTMAVGKKLVFSLFGTLEGKFQAGIADEQEALAALADMIGEIYLAESAALRALEARARRRLGLPACRSRGSFRRRGRGAPRNERAPHPGNVFRRR